MCCTSSASSKQALASLLSCSEGISVLSGPYSFYKARCSMVHAVLTMAQAEDT